MTELSPKRQKLIKPDSSQDISENIPKSYDSNTEMELYDLWEKSGAFDPDTITTGKNPFVIALPPPNANDKLHIGHTCGYSFQDCMGRYNRMKGHPTLLIPGKDHAGIQTEAVFTKVLAKQGINKWRLGRDEFYKRSYEYCMANSKYAREQERRIGLSADWSREKFTLDPELTEIVYDTFFKMFEEKLIFRGEYIVNMCPHCRTALANIDTEHVEKNGIFAYIRYPIVGSENEFVTVATTRPETMLGDTAVAVNPQDKRYKKLVGMKVELPLTGRTIPLIADRTVNMDTGTGCLKVTPAHSAIDFKIGKDHNLDVINVIDGTAVMTDSAPEQYRGMSVTECREAILSDLKKLGLLDKVEEIVHDVMVCERCQHDIEQIISKQWFVNVKPLAQKAVEVLKNGETKILPSNQGKVLMQWFKNIEPWCVSRQLWWGHRIPIWYCGSKDLYDWLLDHPDKNAKEYEEETGKIVNGCGQVIPSSRPPLKCAKCAGEHIEPETDLFDTWFSSGQWPYSTLGGLGAEDFKKYYPTDVLETMRDILFFWVARMMMMGLYRTGKTPFHTVYLHGMICAPDGTKMSKSRGNNVQPDEVFAQYGADAIRLWYYTDTLPGQNTPVRHEKLKGNRNLVNKIWNASRYVLLQTMSLDPEERENISLTVSEMCQKLSTSSQQWEAETYRVSQKVTQYLDLYRFNLAIETLREFFWHTFCDKWIEETKNMVAVAKSSAVRVELLSRLIAILAIQMKLFHPFAPFVTERVWQSMRSVGLLSDESEILMMARWPVNED